MNFRVYAVWLALSSSFILTVSAQNTPPVALWVESQKADARHFEHVDMFTKSTKEKGNPRDQHQLQISPDVQKAIGGSRPDALRLQLPYQSEQIELELLKVEVTTPDFKVLDAVTGQALKFNLGVYYRGIISNDPNSIATIMISEGEVSGYLSSRTLGELSLEKVRNQPDLTLYQITGGTELFQDSMPVCSAKSAELPISEVLAQKANVNGCVRVSIDVDSTHFAVVAGYDVSVMVNHINGLMNQVYAAFQNEQISMMTSQVYIWTIPTPFNFSLVQYAQHRPTFDGDISHVLYGTNEFGAGLSGVAAGVINCTATKPYSFVIRPLAPVAPASASVITHELGHNLGSPHTQSCSWPGGALDNLEPPEGTCPPGPPGQLRRLISAGGGPIANGFGALPGDLIRNTVANAGCLSATCSTSGCPVPEGCTITDGPYGVSVEISWDMISGTSYNIKYKPKGGSILTLNNVSSPHNVTGLTPDTYYDLWVEAVCGANTSLPLNSLVFQTGCKAPAYLSTLSVSNISATVNWTIANGAVESQVKYGPPGFNPDVTGTLVTVTNVSTAVLTGLTVGTSYDWYVRSACVEPGAYSQWSGPESFTTLPNGGGANYCEWIGGVNDWSSSGTNWTCLHIPTAADTVVINGGFITLTNHQTCKALYLNTGIVSGDYDITVLNTFSQNSSTIQGLGQIVVDGQFVANTGSGFAQIEFFDKNLVLNGGAIVTNASLNFNGYNGITFNNTELYSFISNIPETGFDVYAGGTGPVLLQINPGATVEQSGSASSHWRNVIWDNQGTIRLTGAHLLVGEKNDNFDPGISVGGVLDIADGKEVRILQGTYDFSGANLIGLGTLTSATADDNQTFAEVKLNNTTTATNTFSLKVSPASYLNLNGFNGTLKSVYCGGQLTGSGNITTTGNLTMAEGGFLNLDGNINVQDTLLSIGEATVTGNGALTANFVHLKSTGGSTAKLYIYKDFTLQNNVTSNFSENLFSIQGLKTFNLPTASSKFIGADMQFSISGHMNKPGTGKFSIHCPSTFFSSSSVTVGASDTLVFTNAVFNQAEIKGIGTIEAQTVWQNEGIFSPGTSPGELSYQGDYVNYALDFEIDVNTLQHDKLTVTGDASLSGVLNILALGTSPIPNGTYTILEATGTISGTFSTVNYPSGCANCSISYTPQEVMLVVGDGVTLNLSQTFIEGYFNTCCTMTPALFNSGVMGATNLQTDSITVALHAATTPFQQVHLVNTVLNTNGTATASFPPGVLNNAYYLVIKGRNILETWSAMPITFSQTNIYHFGQVTQAYGSNLKTVNGTPVIYSGDIDQNKDGNVDLLDYPVWETFYNMFGTGYLPADLNGDGNVDLLDYPIWEANYNNFISVSKP